MWKNVLASYIHLHFGSNPQLAQSLVDRCHTVDIGAVNTASIRAAIDTEAAMAAAEQHMFTHNGHQYGMMNGAMHKIMSVPDLAMPLQTSLHRSSTLGRLSGDSSVEEIDKCYAQSHHQQAQQHLQQQVMHQQQRQLARERLAVSPQRTSSLPIFHRPLKPYSMPSSPLHEVAEHSTVHSPVHPTGSRTTQHVMQLGVSPPMTQPDLMQQHQQQLHQQADPQLHQQLYQQQTQLQRSPFHSPLQGSSPHGTHTPPYLQAPLDHAHTNGMHPGPDSLQTSPSMMSVDYNSMTSHSGMLSMHSSMLPDSAVYRPMLPTHSGVLPSTNSHVLPPSHSHMSLNSLKHSVSGAHPDGVGFRADETATASTSGYRSRLTPAGALANQSSSALQPHSPSNANTGSIVSLLCSGTEILYALGLKDR